MRARPFGIPRRALLQPNRAFRHTSFPQPANYGVGRVAAAIDKMRGMHADGAPAIEGPDREGQGGVPDFEYLRRPDDGPRDAAADANQPVLFGLEEIPVPPARQPQELVVPESLRTIRKAVAAIHAIPVKGSEHHTLNSQRLFDALILAAQLQVKNQGGASLMERIRNERVSPEFEIRITELVKLAAIPGKNYQRVYESLDQLFRMTLSWNVVGEDSTVQWEFKAHFLATLGRGVNGKSGLLRFSIDPSILAIVLEPKNWATLSLQVMSGLPTPTSYALYQNVWRYVNTAQKVTAALPVETWMELLLGPCRFVKTDAKGNKRAEGYGEFKARYLLDAIERVNQVAALQHTIELKEIKSGRRVVKLQFRFVRKEQQRLELPVSWPADILDSLAALGFHADEIATMSEAFPQEMIQDCLVRYTDARRKLLTAGKKISSPRAYFAGIMDKVARADDEQIDAEKLEAQVRKDEVERDAQERRARLEERFRDHVRDRFRESLLSMPENQRNSLLADFEASPDYLRAKLLVEAKGWTRTNTGAIAMLRTWVEQSRPDFYAEMLPAAQDRDLQAWLLWQTEQAILKADSA